MSETEDAALSFVEGVLIVTYGMILIPIEIVTILCSALANPANGKPEQFTAFFKTSLGFADLPAPNLTFRYLACADAFGFDPGLGATKGTSPTGIPVASLIASELAKVGVGMPGSAAGRPQLRLADFLKQYKTPAAAKAGLTPAKRDALAMEARKLLSLPASAFKGYYKSNINGAGGVRG
jgi:hypothetical protein